MVQSRGEVVQVIVCSSIHDLPVLQEGCCGLEEWGGLPTMVCIVLVRDSFQCPAFSLLLVSLQSLFTLSLPKNSSVPLVTELDRQYLLSYWSIFRFAVAIVGAHNVLVQDTSEHVCTSWWSADCLRLFPVHKKLVKVHSVVWDKRWVIHCLLLLQQSQLKFTDLHQQLC